MRRSFDLEGRFLDPFVRKERRGSVFLIRACFLQVLVATRRGNLFPEKERANRTLANNQKKKKQTFSQRAISAMSLLQYQELESTHHDAVMQRACKAQLPSPPFSPVAGLSPQNIQRPRLFVSDSFISSTFRRNRKHVKHAALRSRDPGPQWILSAVLLVDEGSISRPLSL